MSRKSNKSSFKLEWSDGPGPGRVQATDTGRAKRNTRDWAIAAEDDLDELEIVAPSVWEDLTHEEVAS